MIILLIIGQACSVLRLLGISLVLFLGMFMDLGQYPATSTEQALSITRISFDYNIRLLSRETLQVPRE